MQLGGGREGIDIYGVLLASRLLRTSTIFKLRSRDMYTKKYIQKQKYFHQIWEQSSYI